MTDDLAELFGSARVHVRRDDGITEIMRPELGHTDWDSTKRWHATCHDWDGNLIYDGPAPVPDDLCTITLAELSEGRAYSFVMTPIED